MGNHKPLTVLLTLCLMLSMLPACSPANSPEGSAQAQTVRSEKSLLPAPDESDVPLSELVSGNTAFALALYQQLFQDDSNLFCSPYSISLALAMTYAGARAETAAQMAEALRLGLPAHELHLALRTLQAALSSRGLNLDEGQRFQLHVANALWGQAGYRFDQAFLDVLAENYDAGMRLLDFAKQPDDSRKVVNEWVEEQTEEKIKDLLPKGSIDALTRLVLTNGIYFNASWLYPFNEGFTRDESFFLADGRQVSVPTMHRQARFGYAEGSGYQIVQLLYAGGELSMLVILPAAGTLENLVRSLDVSRLEAMADSISNRELALYMPRFTYEASFQLKDPLSALGMGQAFTAQADFSGMTGKKDLFISDVFHKAFVAVDEEGTEAAAATAVVVGQTAMPMEALEVRINRPFLYLIRDEVSGTILFLGQVANPGA